MLAVTAIGPRCGSHNSVKPTLHRAWAADLDTATLYKLLLLRVAVFVVEQQCAYPELDGRDLNNDTRHIWLEQDGQVICTARLLELHEGGNEFRLGRLCTAAGFRGQGHTKRVLQAALAEVGDTPCRLDAQSYLVQMYAKHGFAPDGAEFVQDGIAHTPMRRPARS